MLTYTALLDGEPVAYILCAFKDNPELPYITYIDEGYERSAEKLDAKGIAHDLIEEGVEIDPDCDVPCFRIKL